MTVDYKAIAKLNKDEITAKISSGKIEAPLPGAERDKFFAFASADPDSEVRTTTLSGLGIDTSSKSPDEDRNKPSGDPKGGDQTEKGGEPSEDEVGKSSSEPKWKQMGYASEEEALEKLAESRGLALDLQTTIDRLNATRGKSGQEAKKLKEKLETQTKELEELRKKTDEGRSVEVPAMPDMPKASDFDDGEADDGYTDAMSTYRGQVTEYQHKRGEYDKAITERLDQLDQTIRAVAPKAEQAHEYMESTVQSDAKTRTTDAWDDMWEKNIPVFQKDFNLPISVPAKAISNANSTIKNPDADAGEIQKAQVLIKSLSKVDLENYAKVVMATEAYYDFSEGLPKAQYRTMKGALVDRGLMPQFSAQREVQPTIDEERQHHDNKLEQGQLSNGIPAERLASGDRNLADTGDPAALQQRFSDLTNEYNAAIDAGPSQTLAFEQSAKFEEYKTVRQKVTGQALPKFHKSERPGFKQ